MKNHNEVKAAGSRIKDEEVAKHTIKDSVFTNLFQDKRYLLQLYKTLHPEDTQVTEDALSDELYVIYTGDRKERTEYISLADEFFDRQKTFLDAKIKVLYGSGQGDIISQYVTFTKVYDGQRKLHGRTRKAVTETIRICKDKNVLKEYLDEREKEVKLCEQSLNIYVGNV